ESSPAFGVRVGARRKTFIVVVNDGHRIKLGNYPRTTLKDARKEAYHRLSGRGAPATVVDAPSCGSVVKSYTAPYECRLAVGLMRVRCLPWLYPPTDEWLLWAAGMSFPSSGEIMPSMFLTPQLETWCADWRVSAASFVIWRFHPMGLFSPSLFPIAKD